MRTEENIKEFVKVRKPDVTTSCEMDKRTLDDSFSAMEQTMRANIKPSTARIITLGRVIKLTAAVAAIIIGISLYVHQGPGEQNAKDIFTKALDSPPEIMTMKSLKIAFRRGGVEAIENQCEKALKILGPEPAKISLADLFNGSQS